MLATGKVKFESVAVLWFENWVSRSSVKKIYTLEKVRTKKKVLIYKYIMNSCYTLYYKLYSYSNNKQLLPQNI